MRHPIKHTTVLEWLLWGGLKDRCGSRAADRRQAVTGHEPSFVGNLWIANNTR